MRIFHLTTSIACCLSLWFAQALIGQTAVSIIPKPANLEVGTGYFTLKADTRIFYPKGQFDWEKVATYMLTTLRPATGFPLVAQPLSGPLANPRPNSIYLVSDETQAEAEGYTLSVEPNSIVVRARTAAGAFYAVQTLRQLLPTAIFSSQKVANAAWKIPVCHVDDTPRFAYRGLHLDVGRHFMPVSFVKEYIDVLAAHKMNRFHWHLTEDQGWRIEIKKYPKLQSVAACRNETLVGHYKDQPHRYDGKRYCGYYTQAEIKEVVDYAAERFVTIVPEIEMPGHSLAALAAYPELGCTGGPYQVGSKWGVYDDVYCAGNEQVFKFLDDVLSEVTALFPGKYVHIGGDECPKARWKTCSKCQARIKKENLHDEHELQSYFIKRAEKMLSKYGKRLIGWDEILEGGLPETATVMSWRGTEGGIAAAKAGHDVVMTPGSHVYFDHYQADPAAEPLAIGGLTTLEKTYSYEPIPEVLSETEAKHVLGAQGNVWTEYLATPDQVEYMAYPRASALAEVLWSPTEGRQWTDFAQRIKVHFQRLEALGLHYAKSYFNIRSVYTGGKVGLIANDSDLEIRYTTDGTPPKATSSLYKVPFTLPKTTTIQAVAFQKGKQVGVPLKVTYTVHKASGKTYWLTKAPEKYTGGEQYALTNGVLGSSKSWDNWVGLVGKDLDPVIDFQTSTTFTKVTARFLSGRQDRIYPPTSVQILVSDDGNYFTPVTERVVDASRIGGNEVGEMVIDKLNAKGRYLKVVARNVGLVPAGMPGAGNGAWVFMDEVIVE